MDAVVPSPWMPLCVSHDWVREHHIGDGGEHYCPTGFDTCTVCLATRDTPEGEEECHKWGTA